MTWYNPFSWVPKARDDHSRDNFHAGDGSDGSTGGQQGLMDREHYGPSDPESVASGINGQNGYNTPDNPNAIVDKYAGTSYEGQQTQRAYQNMSPDSTYDEKAYMYGRSPTGADDAANLALRTGADAYSHGYGTETVDRAISDNLQNRSGPSGDWTQQNGALGQAAGYGSQLAGLETTEGPSAAQAQLQAGTNAAMGSQVAMARSGRGFGGSAGASGLAQSQLAGLGAANANQSAALRAQENAAWRGRQAANMGNAAGIQTAIGSQYGQQGEADLGAALTARGQNDSAALGWAAQGDDAYKAGVGANLAGQAQASGVRGQEMAGGQALADRQLRAWAARNGYGLQQEQMDNQKDAAYLSAGATATAALIAASDIRGKTNIVPSDEAGRQFARGGDGAIDPGEFDDAHPGVATSYLTDQGRENYAKNDALRLKHEAAGREFGEYGDDGLGKRSANYRSNANSVARGMAFDGTLYRPGGGDQNPYAEPASPAMTPMQQQYMGGGNKPDGGGQSGAPAAAESTFAPEARPDTSKPFDLDSMDASSLDAVRNSPASFYDYKDPSKPGSDAQRHYGPMAQDLAKTPAGASAVVKQPDGSLGVDTGRLALVHNGAISAQQKQLDAIQAQLDAFAKKPTSVQPDKVYGGGR